MQNNKTRFLVFSALFIALTFVVTYTIKIPLLSGYFNLGDVIIMLGAIIFGKNLGFIAGSFGSALADILSGYTVYAPLTFIIKGLEGYLCGYIANYKQEKFDNKKIIIGTFAAGILMALGYFLAEAFILKSLSSALNVNRDIQFGIKVATVNLPFNLLQGLLSGLVSSIIGIALKNNPAIKKVKI
ncbi:ECF transporter S component [Caldicellulosiruptoraceae bacterium PP1]